MQNSSRFLFQTLLLNMASIKPFSCNIEILSCQQTSGVDTGGPGGAKTPL